MPVLPSTISLHLGYRIWIAEMNFDINVIRIYKDYLEELSSNNEDDDLVTKVRDFDTVLHSFRNDIDELRNEMHLLKMKLAGQIRKQKRFEVTTSKADDHAGLKTRYNNFRKEFETLKTKLSIFVTTMHP
jgi:predicted RNase H-like nuclease (RuvC/YqgF family)